MFVARFLRKRSQVIKNIFNNYGNIGRGILYAYLAYAKAIETSNWESVEYILSLLAEKSSLKIKSRTNNWD